jgi:GST-like protein
MADTAPHLLLGNQGCGNVVVECAFALAGLPLECEEVDYANGSPTRERLLAVNPLGQVPALILPDKRVLTESLAIVHYVQDLAPAAQLVPERGNEARPAFHRWSVFLVAAIYPTYTYGDDPKKWVADQTAAPLLRQSTDRHRQHLWLQVEAAAAAPWFLGASRSAIDLYLAVMTRWRPGRKWFEATTPRLVAAARRIEADPVLAPILARHFG